MKSITLDEFEKDLASSENLTASQCWKSLGKTNIIIKVPFFLISLAFVGVSRLIWFFYKRPFMALVFFGLNFIFSYLPNYARMSNFLSSTGKNFVFSGFLVSGVCLLLTIPLISKSFKKRIFEKSVDPLKAKYFEILYTGFWFCGVFYLAFLDAVVGALFILDFLGSVLG